MKKATQRLYRYSVLITLLILAGSANAGEDCVFDPSVFTAKSYQKNPDVEYVKWVAETLTAHLVTKKGTLIRINHWSCNHYGLQADALVQSASTDITAEVLELARMVLDKADYTVVKTHLQNKTLPLYKNQKLDIPSEEYAEFYIEITPAENSIVVSIKFYKN